MFIGHFGIALALKKASPRSSLGSLILASLWLDLIWPIFLILGIESVRVVPGITTVSPFDFTHYPWSHSLVMVILWGCLLTLAFWLKNRDRRQAMVLLAAVLSHWLLDLISHRPDLPLVPGGKLYGLGLWNSLPGTLLVELGIFSLGVFFYLRASRALTKRGKIIFWSLMGFLLINYAGSVLAPPPPDDPVKIGSVGLATLLLVGWGYWVEKTGKRTL
jgi:membrane-bound metal-dependent hydrolase YbcI (DUF457 family)